MRHANSIEALTAALLFALSSACANPAPDEPEPARAEVVAPAPVEPVVEPAAEPASKPAPRAPLPFTWPLPAGWVAETIPFPLGFAPTIPHRGLEELRFAPGMFKAGSEDFWTYAFVWWLEGDVQWNADTLGAELATYYNGLSLAVEQQADFDPSRALVVAKLASAEPTDAGRVRWNGTVSTYDPFVTHGRVELRVEVEAFRCAEQDRTVALFRISPQPAEHAVWTQLAALRDAFRCSP